MCHGPFFKVLSQNPKYVKTHCTDLYIYFHFGIRKWMLENGFQMFTRKDVVNKNEYDKFTIDC